MQTIQKLLGTKYPLIQGGMAQISHYQLASAVSNSGGLGQLTSVGMTGDTLREQIKKTKELTDKPFGVNLMLMIENIPELIQVIIEENVKFITTGAGTPKPYMEILNAADIKVIPVVPSVALAKKMEAIGADAVVAEGMESGGHIGSIATMALTRQVSQAVSIPVIAAGGIADGHGVAAAFALGAQGVQIGTILLATDECPIAETYKQAVIAASDTATIVTGSSHGIPVRSIRNQMTEEYFKLETQGYSKEELETLTLGSLRKAVVEGDVENGTLMAGQITGMVNEIKSVQETVDTMFAEANDVLADLVPIRY